VLRALIVLVVLEKVGVEEKVGFIRFYAGFIRTGIGGGELISCLLGLYYRKEGC
jgi:hypothetical protein